MQSKSINLELPLPAEIRHMIVSYVKVPKDLRGLCLTCKDFCDIARPFLYKTISFSIDKLDDRLKDSLNRDNQGVKHVRYLQLKELEQPYMEADHERHLLDLLQTLAANTLEYIHIDTPTEMTSTIDVKVFQTQQKLQQLVFHSGTLTKLPFALPTDFAQNLSTVSLFIKSTKDTKRYAKLIGKLPSLKDLSLTIMCLFLEHDRQRWPIQSIIVIRELFYQSATKPWTPRRLELKRLFLDGFDFWNCGVELVDSFNVECLEELAILGCASTWIVLQALSQTEVNLSTLIDDRYEDWQPVSAAADDLCQRMQGLKMLKRTFQPLDPASPADSKGIAWNALQSHADTLEILHLDDALSKDHSWTGSSYRSLSDFHALCGTLNHLEQLAIRPPDAMEDYHHFAAFLDCLKRLNTLISLKLYVHSALLQGDKVLVAPPISIEQLVHANMQDLAQLIFSELHESCPQLTALVLHVKLRQDEEGVDARGEAMEYGFLRHLRFDEFGETSITARPRHAHDLRYDEPANEIFYEYTEDMWHLKHAMKKIK